MDLGSVGLCRRAMKGVKKKNMSRETRKRPLRPSSASLESQDREFTPAEVAGGKVLLQTLTTLRAAVFHTFTPLRVTPQFWSNLVRVGTLNDELNHMGYFPLGQHLGNRRGGLLKSQIETKLFLFGAPELVTLLNTFEHKHIPEKKLQRTILADGLGATTRRGKAPRDGHRGGELGHRL